MNSFWLDSRVEIWNGRNRKPLDLMLGSLLEEYEVDSLPS